MGRILRCSMFIILSLLTVFEDGAPSNISGSSKKNTVDVLSIPLAYIILDASDVEFVKPLARPFDIIAAKPDTVELLGSLEGVKKLLLIGPRHERGDNGKWRAMSDAEMVLLMKKVREYGVSHFGYNLENAFHGKDIIEREGHVNKLVHDAGMVHVFGPLMGRLMEQGGEEMAGAADVIVVQAQAFQKSTGFETKKVLEVCKALRKANPNAKVHIQISFLNRDNGTFRTAREVIEDLGGIADYADGVWLFSGPRTSNLFREVFTMLRQPEPASLNNGTGAVKTSASKLARNESVKSLSASRFQPGTGDAKLHVPRNARFATGSWVPYTILGGQVAGDCSPHLARILDESGAAEDQRIKIKAAYKTGANPEAWKAMFEVLNEEQLARIGRRKTLAAPVSYGLVFYVESQTVQRYPYADASIREMVEQVNERFESGGVMRRFRVVDVRTYDKNENTGVKQPQNSGGGSLPADYETHSHDHILIALDEGAGGANWPCPWISSVEVHGARNQPGKGAKEMFTERSAMILCHELGHMMGLPDFYALRIESGDNPVSRQSIPSEACNSIKGTLMDDLGPFHPWDAEIINREIAALPVINHSWIDYQPLDCVVRIIGRDGTPVKGADIRVYRSRRYNYYKQAIDSSPAYQGNTDNEGRLSLGPNVLGADPFKALCFFLVEICRGGKTDYRWFSFIDVNFSFWKEEAVTVVSDF